MFTSIRSIYGAIGVVLFLIALYLVLNNSKGASSLLTSTGNTANALAKTLQGR